MIRQLSLSVLLFTCSMSVRAAEPLPAPVFETLRAAAAAGPGDVILVDFWASWCGPCRSSFPWMNALRAKYAQRGLKILAVNVDKDRSLAAEFLQKTPAEFALLYDPEAELAKAFAVQGMPSSFLLDGQGRILAAHKGFQRKKADSYERDIAQHLTP